MKFQKPFFVELPKKFSVEIFGDNKEKIWIEPTGVHMTYDRQNVYIQYAGEDAHNSYAKLELPSDPKLLRKLSKQINKMAKEMES
ncbi:hypothetical protein [Marinobacterium stanieri]|uniref:hypothetical protein n=1 Tax=Marinobacterium stanieri TaxID=49186 RepID=UPI0002557C9C|nr:hypothetical protein [Marinobacterium stanieri]